MSDIIGLVASAAGGGVIAGVAGLIEPRQDNTQGRARWAHDGAMQSPRTREIAEATQAQIKFADAAGAWRGLAASMGREVAIGDSCKGVNAVRADAVFADAAALGDHRAGLSGRQCRSARRDFGNSDLRSDSGDDLVVWRSAAEGKVRGISGFGVWGARRGVPAGEQR